MKKNEKLNEKWSFAPAFLQGDLPTILAIKNVENYELIKVISDARERVELVRINVPEKKLSLKIIVKTYKKPSKLQEIFGKKRGTKAQRAFRAANILMANGVATPEPVALFEKIDENGVPVESKLLTKFVPEMTDFWREMDAIYAHGNASQAAELMQIVASACRKFHDCGLVHRDLGMQNICLIRGNAKNLGNEKWIPVFIDLDRVRIHRAGTLSAATRGKDLARLWLPSELRWFFSSMYWNNKNLETGDRSQESKNGVPAENPVPAEFDRALRKAVRNFELDNKFRWVRHPIWGIKRKIEFLRHPVPETATREIGIWLWDDKTLQPVIVHDKKHSRAFRPKRNFWRILRGIFSHAPAMIRNYKLVKSEEFRGNVNLRDGFGIALDLPAGTTNSSTNLAFPQQLELLKNLGVRHVLLRAYHHAGTAGTDAVLAAARELHDAEIGVAIALVQDREAVRNPESWAKMLEKIVAGTHDFAEFYEVGHATNRGKWGVWDFRDYEKLLAPAIALEKAFPRIKLVGPANIDFDLHTLPGMLAGVPAGTFENLSQHLYVDRRGAPENKQSKRFDLVAKCRIFRALAKSFDCFASDKIIVSEMNWPIAGAGTFSPCAAFYTDEKSDKRTPPHCTPDEQAQFAARYVLQALASGHVERVYWWNLSHPCFGLVDENGNARPAFAALKNLLENWGERSRNLKNVRFGENQFLLKFDDGNALSWTKTTFPQSDLADGNAETILIFHSLTIAPNKGGIERWADTFTRAIENNEEKILATDVTADSKNGVPANCEAQKNLSVTSVAKKLKSYRVLYLAAKKQWAEFAVPERQFWLPNERNFGSRENAKFFENFLRERQITRILYTWADGKRFPFAEICQKLGVPVYSAIHTDPVFYLQRFRGNGLKMRFKRWWRFVRQAKIYRANAEISEATVLLSEQNFADYLRHLPNGENPCKLLAVANPCGFAGTPDDSIFPQKQKELLFVGRMETSVKQPQLVLKVWQILQNQFPDWHLTMVGGGFDFEEIKHIASQLQLERVSFEGFQNPEKYYRRAAIFCMTSAYEGFPMVLIEAASFACVPVAFNSFAALRDVVADGENGVVVPAFDIEKYAEQVANLMRDRALRERLARAAQLAAHAKYAPATIAQKWRAIFADEGKLG